MRGTDVKIREDRMLSVNGKRFFPIGARHVPKGADAGMLKEAGFNCMRWMAFSNETIASSALDGAEAAGMMFYPYIYNRGDFSKDKDRRKRDLDRLISSVRDHPLMLCYEQQNEPAYVYRNWAAAKADPEGMREASEYIRGADPAHPIRIGHGVFNLVSTLRRYNAAADIVGCNPYPVYNPGMRPNCSTRMDGRLSDSVNQTISVVGDYTSKMLLAGQGRPVWMQLQAGSNEDWYNPTLYTPELKGQGIYHHDRLFPSYYQMRFMAFDSIIRGATAMEWFMYGLDVSEPAWIDVRKVIGELAGLHDILASPNTGWEPEKEYVELGFTDWTGVETLTKKYGGRYVMLSVNTQFDPMDAVFKLPAGMRASRDPVCGSETTADIGDGTVRMFFAPYEVKMIYIDEN